MRNKDKSFLLQIGDIARICGISVQTLRYYEKIGFLKPVLIDSQNNYRYYDKEQVTVITNTRLLQTIGFTLNEIKQFLEKKSINEITDLYYKKYIDIENEMKGLAAKKEQISCYIDFFNSMKFSINSFNKSEIGEIRIKELPETYVVFIKDEIMYDYPSLMFMYNRLLKIIFENQLLVDKNLRTIFLNNYLNIYHKKADIELQLPLLNQFDAVNKNIKQIPDNSYISCLHKGKYPSSVETYYKLKNYADKHNIIYDDKVIHTLFVPIASVQNPQDTVFEVSLKILK